MLYLIDSNVWIKVLKGRDFGLLNRFTLTEPSDMCCCSTVRMELMHGAEKYDDPGLRRSKLERMLG